MKAILARSRPYPKTLPADQRTCTRCGITYRYNPTRNPNLTQCRDCRGVK